MFKAKEKQASSYRPNEKRIGRSEEAFMRRGIDTGTAKSLRAAGFTLAILKLEDDESLLKLGLSPTIVAKLRKEPRSEIPKANLTEVLFANRFRCCVCRDPNKPIIVHHIVEWAQSHDHSVGNLAVLCLNDHDRAHTKSTLTKNLDVEALRGMKATWEAEVRKMDVGAILNASNLDGDAWWYFNHARLYEIAVALKLISIFPRWLLSPERGKQEVVLSSGKDIHLYSGPDCMQKYYTMHECFRALLARMTILNVSDILDRGNLNDLLKAGDVIYVQGAHYFKALSRKRSGKNQSCTGRRKANGVSIEYTFDRYEATSTSAWASWLRGRQSAGSVVRIVSMGVEEEVLTIKGTVLAICAPLRDMNERSYTDGSLFQHLHKQYDDEEFGEIFQI